jgi:hypothetical protein
MVDRDLDVFAVLGHMHKRGVHLDISRGATAGAEMLFEEDWNFELQPITPKSFQIHQGDNIFLRCTHRNPTDAAVAYGESSDTEMCAFIMYYAPALHHWRVGVTRSRSPSRAVAVRCGIEHEARVDHALLRDEPRLSRLAARDEIAQLRGGQASTRELKPHHEPATVAPPRASPSARTGDQRPGLAPRARELELRAESIGSRGFRARRPIGRGRVGLGESTPDRGYEAGVVIRRQRLRRIGRCLRRRVCRPDRRSTRSCRRR